LKGASHFNVVADFSGKSHITVRQKTRSPENSLYIFQKNNPAGLARFSRDGSLRIHVAGEYSISRNSDEKTSVRVSKAEGEKDFNI